jgi:hypothetical protein
MEESTDDQTTAPEPAWFGPLPPRIRLTDTLEGVPVKEHSDSLPDQQDLDKAWAVRRYA